MMTADRDSVYARAHVCHACANVAVARGGGDDGVRTHYIIAVIEME